MRKEKIIILAADANFFDFLMDAIRSLDNTKRNVDCDIGVIDQGLTAEQRQALEQEQIKVIKPSWPDFIPNDARVDRNLGLVIRPYLRDIFGGYQYYLWFDADAWAVTPGCLDAYFAGARNEGAAVALENGEGYTRSFAENKWWYGNHFAAFGLLTAARIGPRTSVNIGILCLRSDTLHWERWLARYKQAFQNTRKLNLDQHAFFAAVHSGDLSTKFLDAEHNWLPTLSRPIWDRGQRALMTPGTISRRIQILHLAGPDKKRVYALECSDRSVFKTSLTYNAMREELGRTGIV